MSNNWKCRTFDHFGAPAKNMPELAEFIEKVDDFILNSMPCTVANQKKHFNVI